MTPLAPAPTLVFGRGGEPAPASGRFVADLDDILEHSLFVEGVTRSGKTNFVRYLIESTYGQVLIIVLDPEGEYATLRSQARPFLVVGHHGRDVAIAADTDAVRRLVDAIVEKKVSTIFDLSEYETEEQHTIVAAVCDALVALPETHEGDKLVVLEELQEFAPESGGKSTSLGSVRRLAKRGLKRGVAMLGSSQRVADVSKGVITMLKSKAIGGTDHTDIPRALDELGLPRRDRQALADLAQGEFWVKGPAFGRHATLVHVPRAESSPPKRRRGEGAAPAAEAPAEIAALAAAIAASAREAEQRAAAEDAAKRAARDGQRTDRGDSEAGYYDDDGDYDYAAAHRDLETKLEAARIEGAQGERARQERLLRVVCTLVDATAIQLKECASTVLESAAGLEGVVEEIGCGWTGIPVWPDSAARAATYRETQPLGISPVASALAVVRAQHELAVETEETHPEPLRVSTPREGSHSGEQRILDALYELESLGIRPATRPQLSIVAGFDVSGGAPNRYLNAAIAAGLVEKGQGTVALTIQGRAKANKPDAVLTPAALRDRALDRCSAGERRILEFLLHIYPRQASRADLSASIGRDVSGGAPNRDLNKLITLGFVEIPAKGMLRAGAVLYPENANV